MGLLRKNGQFVTGIFIVISYEVWKRMDCCFMFWAGHSQSRPLIRPLKCCAPAREGLDFSSWSASAGKIRPRAGAEHLWVLSRTVLRGARGVHSVVLEFEVNGGMIAQGAVAALAVVEGLDVIEDFVPGLGAGVKVPAVNHLQLEGAPEAFHGGVVVAIAFAAHGGDQPGPAQCAAVVGAGVLDAAIGVEQQA